MTKSKSVQASEFYNKLVEEGVMLYIGASGEVRSSPVLEPERYEQLSYLNKELAGLIRGENGGINAGTEGTSG